MPAQEGEQIQAIDGRGPVSIMPAIFDRLKQTNQGGFDPIQIRFRPRQKENPIEITLTKMAAGAGTYGEALADVDEFFAGAQLIDAGPENNVGYIVTVIEALNYRGDGSGKNTRPVFWPMYATFYFL